jgi:hypothetical protein
MAPTVKMGGERAEEEGGKGRERGKKGKGRGKIPLPGFRSGNSLV